MMLCPRGTTSQNLLLGEERGYPWDSPVGFVLRVYLRLASDSLFMKF